MFSRRLTLRQLAEWCRTTGGSLRGGIAVVETFRRSAERGPASLRSLNHGMFESLASGKDVSAAITDNARFFPPLVVGMAKVGVESGHFPEVLKELEKYYRMQMGLRQRLIQQITWPVFQLVMAILVIALVIYILGILGGADILGFGLTGGRGAMIWLGGWALVVLAGWAGYQLARTKLGQAKRVDSLLLSIPVLGPLLKTLALARMTLAMQLTMGSGMPLRRAIPLSLTATDNARLSELAKPILAAIKKDGASMADAFADQHIFPHEFIDVLENAERTGQIPEAMGQLSRELNERAEHQLQLLNQALGWLVWLIVAGIIVFLIFRIAMTAYINPLNDAIEGRF